MTAVVAGLVLAVLRVLGQPSVQVHQRFAWQRGLEAECVILRLQAGGNYQIGQTSGVPAGMRLAIGPEGVVAHWRPGDDVTPNQDLPIDIEIISKSTPPWPDWNGPVVGQRSVGHILGWVFPAGDDAAFHQWRGYPGWTPMAVMTYMIGPHGSAVTWPVDPNALAYQVSVKLWTAPGVNRGDVCVTVTDINDPLNR